MTWKERLSSEAINVNLPNKLTLLRVCMIPFFVVFARMSAFWAQCVAVGIYALACVTDTLDGHIARSRNLITDFGKFMDPIADKLLVMSALVPKGNRVMTILQKRRLRPETGKHKASRWRD